MIKIEIPREKLLKPFQLVSNVVERRNTMPLLAHVLVKITDNRIIIIGTDLEVELHGIICLEQPIGSQIQFSLPAKKFLDICRALPERSMLEIIYDKHHVNVNCGRSHFTLSSLPAPEFPLTPTQNSVVEFTMSQRQLRSLIEKTFFAIPQIDARQYLNGLLIEIKDGNAQALASDGIRLAVNSVPLAVADNSFAQVILPRKGAAELLRILQDVDNEIKIVLNENFITVKNDEFVLISKLINGNFPNYNKIIPKRGDCHLEINTLQLKQALTRVAILSNELFRSVRFNLSTNFLQLIATNPEHEEAIEELDVEYVGEDFKAIFNTGFFIDILNVINSEKICINFKNAASGAIIEEITDSSNCLYLLMPIK